MRRAATMGLDMRHERIKITPVLSQHVSTRGADTQIAKLAPEAVLRVRPGARLASQRVVGVAGGDHEAVAVEAVELRPAQRAHLVDGAR